MPFQRFSETITCWYTRLSFPHVWEPVPVMANVAGIRKAISKPRYSALLILHDEMVPRIKAIEDRLIPVSWPEWSLGQPPEGVTLQRALQRGEVIRPGDPHLEGKWVLSANAKQDSKPWVVTKDAATGNFLPVTDHSLIYSGCEVHVSVGIYTTQIQASAPQINVGLNGMQVTGNRLPSFDNRVSAEQAMSGGPDIAAPPPTPGEADVTPPTYHQPASDQPPTYHQPASDQPMTDVDPNDPMYW